MMWSKLYWMIKKRSKIIKIASLQNKNKNDLELPNTILEDIFSIDIVLLETLKSKAVRLPTHRDMELLGMIST